MVYADPQAVKILVVAQRRNDVSQAVMAPVSAALFEPCSAGRNVQLIVGDEYFLGSNFVEASDGGNSLAGAVHKGGGNNQAKVVASVVDAAGQTKELRFCLK